MKNRLSDKVLSYTADAALEALLLSMGIPSIGGSYEPKPTEEMMAYRANHVSALERIFSKFAR